MKHQFADPDIGCRQRIGAAGCWRQVTPILATIRVPTQRLPVFLPFEYDAVDDTVQRRAWQVRKENLLAALVETKAVGNRIVKPRHFVIQLSRSGVDNIHRYCPFLQIGAIVT